MSLQEIHQLSAKSSRINGNRRKLTFTLENWIPVVEKWESRDRTHDSFTLAELIAEHFGTQPDGTPVVSTQSYYAWRKRVLAERAKAKG
ncbi:MAG: hypothetical protein ISR59_03980 [Anaerolineales bacterium]|nr:hypothetical protein [Anaerolineales bacterium]